MNKVAITTLIPIVATVVAPGGCTTMSTPAVVVPGQIEIGWGRISWFHSRKALPRTSARKDLTVSIGGVI